MASFASPGGRVTTTSTSSAPTAGFMQNRDLTDQLEKLKLQNAIRAAQGGQSAGADPNMAAQLAAQMERLKQGQQGNQSLQTERLQSSERMSAAQLAAQMAQLQARQSGDRTIQGDRLQSSERMTAAQLAAQMARLNTDIKGKKDLQAGDIQGKKDLQNQGSLLEEQRRKDAAARALAMFRATPGGGGGKLDVKGAAAELG